MTLLAPFGASLATVLLLLGVLVVSLPPRSCALLADYSNNARR